MNGITYKNIIKGYSLEPLVEGSKYTGNVYRTGYVMAACPCPCACPMIVSMGVRVATGVPIMGVVAAATVGQACI